MSIYISRVSYSYLLFIEILSIITFCFGQDIIGCGGFIKADVPLDLTQIKVKLLTSYGSVKYTSEPAPNGYYMIPVYEKGEYQIQIQPKEGWNFQPSNPVNLDLDACERNEDVNFVFTGFQISGQVVSGGSQEGPSNVEVKLIAKDGKELQTTKTVSGKYSFNNVLAGQYVVKAVHPEFLFSKSEVTVDVKDDVVEAKDSPVIHGYSVSGSISNEGQPAKGVSFIIQSLTDQKVDIKGCTAGSPPNYSQKGAICYVSSDESGKFRFNSVPVGKYKIVPFHRGEKAVFDVSPNQLSIEVAHANLHIQTSFTVSGFGVSGQVKYSSKGKGISGAVVSIDGKEVAKTDSHGSYAIDGMKSGTYTVNVKAPSVYFDAVKVEMLPSEPLLPLITPNSFDLCGQISLDEKRSGISVSVTDVTDSNQVYRATAGVDGMFCVPVKPGTYTLTPQVQDLTPALTVTPTSMKVTVSDSPVSSDVVKFSQFKAVVSGEVMCLSACGDIDVVLRSNTDNSIIHEQKVTTTKTTAAFVFQGVIPGEYSISAVRSTWCWVDNSKPVVVAQSDVSHIVLKQKGYGAIVESSNTMSIRFSKNIPKDKKSQVKAEEGKFDVMKGTNEICLPSTGQFEITPVSCHVFDKSSYIFDTASANSRIEMRAVRYKVILKLTSEQPVSDVTVKLRSDDGELLVNMPQTKEQDGKHLSSVERELDVAAGSTITASLSSALVLFQQKTYTASINPDLCPSAVVEMQAYRGRFVEGQVTPAMAGLNIQLTEASGNYLDSLPTDKHGRYRFGPLPDNDGYVVTAEKPGYVLAKEDNNPFNFKAFKLAEVSVHVKGSNGVNLPGVILSLSGNSYKSNNRTDENGFFSFIGLSPGLYYLKAILKEYEFSPASLQVEVKEGMTEEVKVVGNRVAYSCTGDVVNLNGKPVSHPVVVRAEGLKGVDCINTEETSQTEPNGYFRVRGLKPGCTYKVSVNVLAKEDNDLVYRASPESFTIADMKPVDMNVGRFTVVESSRMTAVTVFIKSHRQFLSTLKIVLKKDDADATLQSITPGNSKVSFLSSLPMDSTKYKVYLESTLSKAVYDYEITEKVFVADESSIALTLQFDPKTRTKMEYEVKESSLLALVVVILVTVLVLNKDKVLNLFNKQR